MSPKPKIVAIIQARIGATRLPGKVLLDINGQPMLRRVYDRVRQATLVNFVTIATTDQPGDEAVADYCRQENIPCFRGNETDVLDRYYQAAKAHAAEVVVRITADCPLMDPQVIDKVVAAYLAGNFDYVTNVLRYTYPDGLDVEVFSFAALERAWHMAKLPAEREHVTSYIRNSGQFRLGPNVEHEVDLSRRNLRWTVDTPADLEFVRRVFAELEPVNPAFGLDNVLALLDRNPRMSTMNTDSARNEGYYKSLAKEPPVPARARSLACSQKLLEKARRLIPSCSQTFSKAPTQFVQGVAPNFIARGQGSHVWDADGNEYIDYPMALAPIILGHNDPEVTAAVAAQIQLGNTYSLPHPLEVEVAEMLVDIIPCAEMVRFGKNGSDATSGAVRVARAFTGRDMIACCGYHGWQDWYIGATTRHKGVPQAVRDLTVTFTYNDINSLKVLFEQYPNQIAAVVMEPVGVVEPHPDFLPQIRELTKANGALLVYDEIVTGFRFALGGAQEFFGVIPDLACCGKAMANGYPLAAVVGRRDVMEVFDEVFFSFTFGGETVSLAAAVATIRKLKSHGVIGHLWAQGQKLQDGYNTLAREFGVDKFTECIGYPPRTVITFRDETGAESLVHKSYFQQECLKRGILFSGGMNLSYSHSDGDVDDTLRVYRTAMELLAEAIKTGEIARRLEGPPVQPVFRKA